MFFLSLLLLPEPRAEPLPPCGLHRGSIPLALRQLRSLAPSPKNTPLTCYEPNIPDDFHYSETTEIFFQEQSSDTVPSYLFDAELDDETIGRALSSPLFIQEREELADRRQAHLSFEESLLPAQSFCTRACTGRPVYEPSSDSSQKRKWRLEEVLVARRLEKGPSWECRSVDRQAQLFLSVYVDDIENVWEKSQHSPAFLKLKKKVDLEEPTPLNDQVDLGCTQRE